jgi:hypothetical protein
MRIIAWRKSLSGACAGAADRFESASNARLVGARNVKGTYSTRTRRDKRNLRAAVVPSDPRSGLARRRFGFMVALFRSLNRESEDGHPAMRAAEAEGLRIATAPASRLQNPC